MRRLLRKAVATARSEGLATTAALTARKVADTVVPARGRRYPHAHLAAFDDVDPFDPTTLPRPRLAPRPGEPLRLRWYVPEPGRGSGGHRTMMRIVEQLQRRGHHSEVAVLHGAHTGRTREETSSFIHDELGGVRVPVVWDTDPQRDVDVVVATSWQSAYAAVRDTSCALRAYLVQDWEPDFYARGSEALLAENSYRLGLHHLTAGPWLAGRLRDMGTVADHFPLAADPAEYFHDPGPRAAAGVHVVFYARPFTRRRCFEMGVEALRLLDRRLGPGRLLVSAVGADLPRWDLPFRMERLGILTPAGLRRLYSGADAVMVLSATNTSLVPLEAALCRVPVVDLDVPSVAGTLEDGVNARLAPPSPAALARVLEEAARPGPEREALVERARNHAAALTWERAGEAVAGALEAAVAAAFSEADGGG